MGIRASKLQPEGKPRFWYRDNFFLTTDKTYLDHKLVNGVFDSDLMWWNGAIEHSQMKKMLDNCLTFAVFWVPETEEQMNSKTRLHKRHPTPARSNSISQRTEHHDGS